MLDRISIPMPLLIIFNYLFYHLKYRRRVIIDLDEY